MRSELAVGSAEDDPSADVNRAVLVRVHLGQLIHQVLSVAEVTGGR